MQHFSVSFAHVCCLNRTPNSEYDELLLLVDCSEQAEWKDIVLYLPL